MRRGSTVQMSLSSVPENTACYLAQSSSAACNGADDTSIDASLAEWLQE